jgi:ATP-dependent helicase HrpA
VREIEALEHRSRRPDILVDDSLIEAFYDGQIPADVHHGAALEAWWRQASRQNPKLLFLNRDELMRHEAAGITTEVFPKTLDLGSVVLAVSYHFEPGSVRDGVTVTVPVLALGQLDPSRFEWLVPGLLKEKVHLLLKSLPQKLRRHCVPLPDYAAGFHDRFFDEALAPSRSLMDALIEDLLKQRDLRVQPSDFKPETLPAHLFMNFKVVDEHGRMLAAGRNLAQLKSELRQELQQGLQQLVASEAPKMAVATGERLTDWTFETLPELLEIRRRGVSVIGYPALVDRGDSCEIDVFDDPDQARRAHRSGLLRLFRLQLRETVKFLEKNLPDLQKLGMLFIPLGTQDEIRDQVIDVAIVQACLQEPWPADAAAFRQRLQEGKGRLGLLAQEVARLALIILTADITEQLRGLVSADFLRRHEWSRLSHFPRYLKAVAARLEKLRTDPARDGRLMSEWQPLYQRWVRELQQRKGVADPQLEEFRWLLEELRVALYAQELRTPMPVSVKRLTKAWEAIRR